MNIKKIFLAAWMVVGAVLISSCNNDGVESLFTDDYTTNFIYMLEPASSSHKVSYLDDGSFLNSVGTEETLVPLRSRFAAPSDIQIEVCIDETLIDEYNKENNTDCVLLKCASLEKKNFSIKAGQYASADSLKILYSDEEEFKTAENFIVPLRIVSTSVGQISEVYNKIYLIYTAGLVRYIIQSGNSGMGTRLSSGITYYKNGSKASRLTGYLTYNTEYLADMGSTKSLTGVYFGGYSSYYCVHKISLSISEDGETWTDFGEIEFPYTSNGVIFPAGLPARYVKFVQLNNNNNDYLSSFYLYIE